MKNSTFLILFISAVLCGALVSAPSFAHAQDAGSKMTSKQYIDKVRSLLKQVSTEYRSGNFTGADALATMAYLDNFEYVEKDLLRHGATQLKEQTEQMMRIELRDMIKNRVTADQLDAHITAINAKLDNAYVVVPEFPIGTTFLALSVLVGSIIVATRAKGWGSPSPIR